MHVEWRLQQLLQREGVTPYGPSRESGLSTQSLYPLVREEVTAIRAHTLIRLTGTQYGITDILEVVPEPAPRTRTR